jgi:hypothetical protein
MISHFVVGLDEEIDTQKGISPFRLRLRRLSKKEVSRIEEEDLSPLLFYLGNQTGFLGDTAKRASKSSAGLNLTHHIIGVDDAELSFEGALGN